MTTGGLYGTLAELVEAWVLDSCYASGSSVSGYNYSLDLSSNRLNYTVEAIAASSVMGRFDFYATTDYIVRYSTEASRAPAGLAGALVGER